MKKALLMIGIASLFGILVGCSGEAAPEQAAAPPTEQKPASEGGPTAQASGKVPELSANPNGKITEAGSAIGGK